MSLAAQVEEDRERIMRQEEEALRYEQLKRQAKEVGNRDADIQLKRAQVRHLNAKSKLMEDICTVIFSDIKSFAELLEKYSSRDETS